MVVTASGTATVQTAIHERPMVIVYRLSPLTYRLGKRFVKVDTFGMANLVAGRRIVPELIQDAFTPDAVADETARYFEDADYAARTRAALRRRARAGSATPGPAGGRPSRCWRCATSPTRPRAEAARGRVRNAA